MEAPGECACGNPASRPAQKGGSAMPMLIPRRIAILLAPLPAVLMLGCTAPLDGVGARPTHFTSQSAGVETNTPETSAARPDECIARKGPRSDAGSEWDWEWRSICREWQRVPREESRREPDYGLENLTAQRPQRVAPQNAPDQYYWNENREFQDSNRQYYWRDDSDRLGPPPRPTERNLFRRR